MTELGENRVIRIHRNYNCTELGRKELTGYAVTNAVMVESSDPSSTSSWIDVAVNAGAKMVGCLSLTLSEERVAEIRAEITQDAIKKPRTRRMCWSKRST